MSSAGLSIGELVGTVSLNDLFSPAIKDVSKATGIATESFKAMGQAAGLIGGALVTATGAVIALGIHGADVADVSSAFDRLATAAGSTSAEMLGALQAGTLNTISNFDLMKAANGVLGSGLVTTADQMKTLAASAHLLADRTGGDASTAFDTLTSAMASGRTAGIKQLGVFVDSNVAVEAYAKSIHRNVSDLSEHQVATAKSQAILAALKQQLEANGPATVDFGDRINQGKAAIANFTDNVAVAVANSPALAVVMDAISTAIRDAFGGNNQQAIQTISEYVAKFGIFLVGVAEVGVKAAEYITSAFDGTKVVFNTVLQALFEGIGAAAGTLADLADKAAALPVVGSAFAGLAGDIHATADMANSLAIGFGEQADAAIQSSNTTTIAFAAVEGVLADTKAKMEAVQGATVDLGVKGPPAIKNLIEPAQLTAAEIKAIEDATRKAQQALFDLKDNGAKSFQELQDQMTLANLTGTEARLFEIQLAQNAELAGYQGLALNAPVLYQQITDAITEKYRILTAAAQGYFDSAALFAQNSGFITRDQMEQNVANALVGYSQMLLSGQFTAGELTKAWKKYIDAKKQLDDDGSGHTKLTFQDIASAASTILTSIFGKNKKAAIAGAIIDAAAAIVKCFAQFGWWGFIPAAAVAAQTYAQIKNIEAQDPGFATGTPGTSFVDFGRETHIAVHGPEAVINQAQGGTLGDLLAGMVSDALRSGQGEVVAELRKQGDEARRREALLPLRLRDAVLLGAA